MDTNDPNATPPIVHPMAPDLAVTDPATEAAPPEGTAAPAAPAAPGLTLESLQQELATLRNDNQQYQSQIRDLTTSLITRVAAPAAPAPAPAAPPTLSYEGLPDPVQDLPGFMRELAARNTQYLDTRIAGERTQFQSENQRNQAYQNGEAVFRTRHAQLASKTGLFQTAVAAEAQRLKSMGIDPFAALAADTNGFMDRVANSMYAELNMTAPAPAAGGAPASPPGVPATIGTGAPAAPAAAPPANRTAGVSGGSTPAGGTPAAAAHKPTPFIKQFNELQAQGGLY